MHFLQLWIIKIVISSVKIGVDIQIVLDVKLKILFYLSDAIALPNVGSQLRALMNLEWGPYFEHIVQSHGSTCFIGVCS